MKSYAMTVVGALFAVTFGCQVSVDDYCDDDDWDDDDDHPCETHVHADTTTIGGSATSGGSASTDGSGGGSTNVSVTTGGSSTVSGGSGGTASGSTAGSGGSSSGSGADGSGGTASGDSGGSTGGSSGGSVDAGTGGTSDSGTTGAAGDNGGSETATSGSACDDCAAPDSGSCLWGTTTMDACCTADVLVDVAAQGCAGVDLSLRDFALENACAGGHYQVSYQCCLAPEETCAERTATLEVCVTEDILMSLAEQWCGESSQVVAEITAGDECGDGTYQSLTATCCTE